MRRFLGLALAMLLLCSAAMAEVCTTGDVNLRSGPGVDYGKVGSVSAGTRMEYLGETIADARGVDWYKVSVDGMEVWVSSKYGALTQEESAQSDLELALDLDAETVEVADCYMMNLHQAAAAVGLSNYHEVDSEAPCRYYNDGVTLGGWGTAVEYIRLTGAGYSVYGVTLGMKVEEAKERLLQAGLHLYDEWQNVVTFEHRADEKSYIDVDGYDSCINLWVRDGVVVDLDWNAYTG